MWKAWWLPQFLGDSYIFSNDLSLFLCQWSIVARQVIRDAFLVDWKIMSYHNHITHQYHLFKYPSLFSTHGLGCDTSQDSSYSIIWPDISTLHDAKLREFVLKKPCMTWVRFIKKNFTREMSLCLGTYMAIIICHLSRICCSDGRVLGD